MSQCRGRRKDGARCRKVVRGGSHYCAMHADQEKKPSKLPIALGMAAGHWVAPGLGGMIVGGLMGSACIEEKKMSKTRVFVSFDYDHDVSLKHLLVGQSKYDDSPFEIADHSIKAPIAGDWKANAKTRIKRADVVCVICGKNTHTATGVSAELAIAQEERTPYFLLAGYKDGAAKKPRAAKPSDKIYKWTWPNLKKLIGGAR